MWMVYVRVNTKSWDIKTHPYLIPHPSSYFFDIMYGMLVTPLNYCAGRWTPVFMPPELWPPKTHPILTPEK